MSTRKLPKGQIILNEIGKEYPVQGLGSFRLSNEPGWVIFNPLEGDEYEIFYGASTSINTEFGGNRAIMLRLDICPGDSIEGTDRYGAVIDYKTGINWRQYGPVILR